MKCLQTEGARKDSPQQSSLPLPVPSPALSRSHHDPEADDVSVATAGR